MGLSGILFESALEEKNKFKRRATFFAAGLADWVAGTYDETRNRSETLLDEDDERVIRGSDLAWYQNGTGMTFGGEMYVYLVMPVYNKWLWNFLGADLGVRVVSFAKCYLTGNMPERDSKIAVDTTGILGYVRQFVMKGRQEEDIDSPQETEE